ncbi:MAG: aspartate dehydrogenase [Candidatus Thermoplasmatota archaeon]
MNVGIIGCGTIGKFIAKELSGIDVDIWLFDLKLKNANELQNNINKGKVAKNIDELIENCDVIVEAASQMAVREYSEKILSKKKKFLIMSVGALSDKKLRQKLFGLGNIFIPSGAICGIDGIISASQDKLTKVELTTTKPPVAFSNYFKKKGIMVEQIKKRTLLFSGSAIEAIKKFPENVNVAATLSLAGVGFKKTIVNVVADPKIKMNMHLIKAEGAFGKLECKVMNVPFKDNPKTSYLAALSAVGAIKKMIGVLGLAPP